MSPEEAADLINNRFIFRKGWHFQASAGIREVYVTFWLKTEDTSVVSPIGEYTKQVELDYPISFRTEGLDDAGVVYKLVSLIGQLQQHEDREFARVRQSDGSWKAPLHPHNPDGELAWMQAEYLEALR